MTSTTIRRPRKSSPPAPKKDRYVRLLALLPDRNAGVLQITEGKQVDRYMFAEVACDFGRGFLVEKWLPPTDQTDGVLASGYHVCVAGRNSTCECKGNLRWHHCRHVESLTALIASGKLP